MFPPQLPKEMWNLILKDLPVRTLFKLQSVSKQFYNIISNMNWKDRFINDHFATESVHRKYHEFCTGQDFVGGMRVCDDYEDSCLIVNILGDGILYILDEEYNRTIIDNDQLTVDIEYLDHIQMASTRKLTDIMIKHLRTNFLNPSECIEIIERLGSEDFQSYTWIWHFFNKSLHNMSTNISKYFLSYSDDTILPFVGNALEVVSKRLQMTKSYKKDKMYSWNDFFNDGIESFNCSRRKYCRMCKHGDLPHCGCGRGDIYDYDGISEFKDLVESTFDSEKIVVEHVYNYDSNYVGFIKITLPVLISGRECGFFLFLERDS